MVQSRAATPSKQATSETTASVNGQLTASKAALHPTVTSGRCWQFSHTGSSQPLASTTPTTSHDQPNTQDPVSGARFDDASGVQAPGPPPPDGWGRPPCTRRPPGRRAPCQGPTPASATAPGRGRSQDSAARICRSDAWWPCGPYATTIASASSSKSTRSTTARSTLRSLAHSPADGTPFPFLAAPALDSRNHSRGAAFGHIGGLRATLLALGCR
jgi:hypothetical protein